MKSVPASYVCSLPQVRSERLSCSRCSGLPAAGTSRSLDRSGFGWAACPLHMRRRCAKFQQDAIAQPPGIALTSFGRIRDPACENFIGEVAAISEAKRYQGHFICEAHDADRLRVEVREDVEES